MQDRLGSQRGFGGATRPPALVFPCTCAKLRRARHGCSLGRPGRAGYRHRLRADRPGQHAVVAEVGGNTTPRQRAWSTAKTYNRGGPLMPGAVCRPGSNGCAQSMAGRARSARAVRAAAQPTHVQRVSAEVGQNAIVHSRAQLIPHRQAPCCWSRSRQWHPRARRRPCAQLRRKEGAGRRAMRLRPRCLSPPWHRPLTARHSAPQQPPQPQLLPRLPPRTPRRRHRRRATGRAQ